LRRVTRISMQIWDYVRALDTGYPWRTQPVWHASPSAVKPHVAGWDRCPGIALFRGGGLAKEVQSRFMVRRRILLGVALIALARVKRVRLWPRMHEAVV